MATTNYPGSLDAYSVPNSGDNITVASHWLGPAVIGIETELGTDPAGYATNVKTRLSDINPTEGNLNLDAGYGSKAPIYGVRAWVNFNGTGTVAISASANVSSITDNGTGDYTVNFSTTMPNVNYCWAGSIKPDSGADADGQIVESRDNARTTSALRILTREFTSDQTDALIVQLLVVR